MALKTVNKASPQAGFAARFEDRLAARKAAERRRRYLGSIHPGINLLAFAFSAGFGVLFGFLPAKRAAAHNPIDALRHE